MKSDKNYPITVLAMLDDRKDSRTDKYEQEWNGFWQFFNVMQFNRSFAAVCTTGLDAHAYVALPYGQDESTPVSSVQSGSTSGWSEIKEMIFDDATLEMAGMLEEKNIEAPEEAGYELADDSGEIVAEIELAWISRNIGYMTEEQVVDRVKAEEAGWKIFTTIDEIETVFGEE